LRPISGPDTGPGERRPTNPDRRGRRDQILIGLLVVAGLLAALTALLPDDPGTVLGGVTGHVILPAVFAFGLCARLKRLTLQRALIVVGCCVLIGVAAELAQLLVGRNVEFTDVLTDLAGGIFGVGMAGLFRRSTPDFRTPAIAALTSLCVAIVAGPLRVSVPVQQWRLCRNFVASDAQVLTLADRSEGTIFYSGDTPVGTSFGPSRSTAPNTASLIKTIRCSESFSLRAAVTPANVEQAGPRRIMAFSTSSALDDQALVVGMEQGAMEVRVRYGRSDMEFFFIGNVFAPGEQRVVEVSQTDGLLRIVVDGKIRLETRPKRTSLGVWGLNLPFNVGDEFGDDRSFEGTIKDVSVQSPV
jgi:VanZ family protein